MVMFLKILFIVLSYIIGSIPFGLILGKIKKIDVRDYGSHNIGATNTGRALGKKYAILTFGLDMCKGALFVVLFRYEIIPLTYMIISPSLYGLVAVIGHLFPVFLKFKGGKGVATGAGVVFAYIPFFAVIALITFYIVIKKTHISAIGSLVSATVMCICSIITTIIGKDFITNVNIDFYFGILSVLLLILIIIKHIPNIKRIINDKEYKI